MLLLKAQRLTLHDLGMHGCIPCSHLPLCAALLCLRQLISQRAPTASTCQLLNREVQFIIYLIVECIRQGFRGGGRRRRWRKRKKKKIYWTGLYDRGWCICHFSHQCDKSSGENDSRRKILALAPSSRVQSIPTAKSWWQGCEAVGHIIPTVQKQRDMDDGTQRAFFFYFSQRLDLMEESVRVTLSFSVKQIWRHHHGHTQEHASMVAEHRPLHRIIQQWPSAR